MPLADSSATTTDQGGRESKGPRAWVGRVLRPLKSPAARPSNTESDPLLAFASETDGHSSPAPSPTEQASPARTAVAQMGVLLPIGLAIVVTAAATFGLTRVMAMRAAAAALKTGALTVQTRPAGAQVTIDDAPRGVTPLTVSLDAGAHTVKVRLG